MRRYQSTGFFNTKEDLDRRAMAIRIERVDKIVDDLDRYRTQPHYFQEDEDNNPKEMVTNSKFRQSAGNLLDMANNNFELQQKNKAGRQMDYYSKKNKVNEKDFFTNPKKYQDWDDKFQLEDYM